MKLIKVEIMADGKTCKELNPMKNLSCTDPNSMWDRWEKLENERQTFKIDKCLKSCHGPSCDYPCEKHGSIHQAKVTTDGKVMIL